MAAILNKPRREKNREPTESPKKFAIKPRLLLSFGKKLPKKLSMAAFSKDIKLYFKCRNQLTPYPMQQAAKP